MIKHFCDRCDGQIEGPDTRGDQSFEKGAFRIEVHCYERAVEGQARSASWKLLCPTCIAAIITGRESGKLPAEKPKEAAK